MLLTGHHLRPAASCRLIRAIPTPFSTNATDPPCTQHGHHSGHNQPVFPWFHDLLQRRDQVIQRRRNGGGGGVLPAGCRTGCHASLLTGTNDSTHSAPSFRCCPAYVGFSSISCCGDVPPPLPGRASIVPGPAGSASTRDAIGIPRDRREGAR